MLIDVHSHLLPEDLPDFAAAFSDPRWPVLRRSPTGTGDSIQRGEALYRQVDDAYWSPKLRLAYLDAYGVDRQVVSPLPVLLPHWAPESEASAFCAWQNEAIARYVARHPDRLSGLGTVPVQHPAVAMRELDHVIDLGLAGVEVGTMAGGGELDDEVHRQFFDAAAERGVPVLLHPLEGEGLGRMDNRVVRMGVGVLSDTAIAATFVLLGDILRRQPGLRLCLSHGGGSFFWALPRLQGLLERSAGPGEAAAMVGAMKRVWVDTASLAPPNLRYLDEILGRDRTAFGTDYPATADRDPLRPLAEVGWDTDARVTAANAAAFLGTVGEVTR